MLQIGRPKKGLTQTDCFGKNPLPSSRAGVLRIADPPPSPATQQRETTIGDSKCGMSYDVIDDMVRGAMGATSST